ncbi:hypothetical protein MMC25_006011 [Agyrium rufum]|nr:hypothetical protein [Agyrium rufum]
MSLRRRTLETENGRAIALVSVSVVALFCAAIAVCLRFLSRRMKPAALALDDYFIVLALVAAFGNGIAEIVGCYVGVIGPHRSQLTDGQFRHTLQCLVAAEICWAVSTWALKMSLLFLYLRIFTTRTFRIAANSLMALISITVVATILFFFLDCRPLVSLSCTSQYEGWLGTGTVNILTDVMILSLPIPSVWNLHLPRSTKLALTVLFGMGFLVCIISILRIISISTINVPDLSYSSVATDIYSVLEPSIGIIAACLAVIRPLFHRWNPRRWRGSSSSSSENVMESGGTMSKGRRLKRNYGGIAMKGFIHTLHEKNGVISPIEGSRGREKSLSEFRRLGEGKDTDRIALSSIITGETSASPTSPVASERRETITIETSNDHKPTSSSSSNIITTDGASHDDMTSRDHHHHHHPSPRRERDYGEIDVFDGTISPTEMRAVAAAIYDGPSYSTDVRSECPTHRHHLEMATEMGLGRRRAGGIIAVKQEWEVR